MEFEHAKTPSYLDPLDNSAFPYIDGGLDYLQYPPSPGNYNVSMTCKSPYYAMTYNPIHYLPN